ncbi:MAG TPA: hypothetical protein VNL34_04940 [Candidatus Nitrosotenuis sp.]|nr:hypothetical protein [Candidatus Nitrosotenuis sp.]
MVKLKVVKSTNWRPIQLPAELVRDLEVFAESGISRALGFTNKSQLAAFALRDFLHKYTEYLSVYQLVDVTENQVTILDHEENKVAKITHDGKFLHCDIDDENYCEHIKFALLCPTVLHVVKKFGYPDENNK